MPHPPSDHFDGKHFFNPGTAPQQRGIGKILRWRLRDDHHPWPPQPAPIAYPKPRDLTPGESSITFIGHASFLLRLPGLAILTDPMWSERASPLSFAGPRRARPPGLALADLPKIDLVLVSHNHYDHLDLPTLKRLNTTHQPRFITTLGTTATLAHAGITAATELDWWQQTQHGPLTVTATQARHFAARTPFDRNRALWAGFMLKTRNGQILFAGDSGAGPHWTTIHRKLGAPDLALLPIGAYDPRWLMAPVHMNPAEAVQAHQDLQAARSIGMHFGTFQLTDEPIDAPLIALREATEQAGLADRFTTLGFGETAYFMAQSP